MSYDYDTIAGGMVMIGTPTPTFGEGFKVCSGGIVKEAMVHQDQYQDYSRMSVQREGIIEGTRVTSGGYLNVREDGIAKKTTVYSGGIINGVIVQETNYYEEGIHISNAIIAGDWWGHIENGQTITSATILGEGGEWERGHLNISSGGLASATTVLSGGMLRVEGGDIRETTIHKGGVINGFMMQETSYFAEGFTVSNSIVGSDYLGDGGTSIARLYSGQTAVSTTVLSEGMLIVERGIAKATTVLSGGRLNGFLIEKDTFFAEGVHVSDTIACGADLYSGQTAVNTIVPDWERLDIRNGGIATLTTVESGGRLNIQEGGIARDTTIYSGGMLNGFIMQEMTHYAETPDSISNAVVLGEYHHRASLYSGQTATATTVKSGYMGVSGGVATATSVGSSGWLLVRDGGTVSNTIVKKDGHIRIYAEGTAANTTILSGGRINGFYFREDTLVANGVHVSNAVVSWFDDLNDVEDWDELLYDNGYATLYSGQTATSTTIEDGGMKVSSGGVAVSTFMSGGKLWVYEGGAVSATSIIEYGTINGFQMEGNIYIDSGVHISNATVDEMEGQTRPYLDDYSDCAKLFAGQTATSTVIMSEYAYMQINRGGYAEQTTLGDYDDYDDYDNTDSGGFVGNLQILEGGVAKNTTIRNQGTIYIASSGTHTGKLAINHGYVYAENGANVNFNLSEHSAGANALIDNLSRIDGAPDYTVTVSAGQQDGIYRLAGGADGFASSITVQSAAGETLGTLTVGNGFTNKGSYSLAKENGTLLLHVSAVPADLDPTPDPDPVPTPDPDPVPTPDPDPSAPAAPDGTSVTVKKYNATFSWNKYAVAKGVKATYQIMVDGNTVTSKSNKYTLKNASVGDHAFSVRAILSEKGKDDVYTAWSVGLTQYVADVTAPKTGKLTLAQTGEDTILLNWTPAVDNVGIARYEVVCGGETRSLDGNVLSTEFSGKAGKVTAAITACDAAGNAGKTVKKTFKMKDMTAPTQVTGLRSEGVDNKSGGVLAWNESTDNVGVTQYLIAIEGGKTYKSKTNSVKVKKMAAGTYRYTVIALDKAKNQSLVSTESEFTVADVINPKIKKLSCKVTNQSAAVSWNATDEVGVVRSELWYDEQRIDTTGLSSWEFSALELGTHSLRLNVWDAAGNMSTKMANCNIRKLDPANASAGMLAAL